MLKVIRHGLVVAALSFAFAGSALALPGLSDSSSVGPAYSSVDDARVFCFNRASGRFLHWGSCYRSAPRVYCKNHWSGEFLHWGSCY